MAAGAVIGRRDVAHTVGVGRKLVALLETHAGFVLRVVDRDGASPGLLHHGEAGHIGRSVAHINHVLEWDGTHLGRHVVVDVLREVEHPLVDAEEELRLLCVADDAFRKSDASFVILGIFAAENFPNVRGDAAAADEFLEAGADDVMLELDSVRRAPSHGVGDIVQFPLEFGEHFRDSREKAQLGAELPQLGVSRAVHLEVVEQRLHVGQLVLVTVLLYQLAAALPELLTVDPEMRKDDLLLHVVGTERLVVIVNDRDGILRDGHGKSDALRAY